MNEPVTLNNRDPIKRTSPQGEKDLDAFDFLSYVPLIGITASIGQPDRVQPRYTNAADQYVAIDAVPTNNAPGFLSGIGRMLGNSLDDAGAAGAKGAAVVGNVVTSLFPWWFWALIGLALTAWIVSILGPVLRRPAP